MIISPMMIELASIVHSIVIIFFFNFGTVYPFLNVVVTPNR